MNKKKILFFITETSLLPGYIDFLEKYAMPIYDIKICFGMGVPRDDIDESKDYIQRVQEFSNLVYDEKTRQWLDECDVFIVSGVFFGLQIKGEMYPEYLYKKTYIQVWGGDYWSLYTYKFFEGWQRNLKHIIRFTKQEINRYKGYKRKLEFFDKCAGFLGSASEKFEIERLLCKPVCFYWANVMDINDARKTEDQYDDYYKMINEKDDNYPKDRPLRIIIGNSATKDNNHIELLDSLKKYKDDNIEIYCPLSYGNEYYGDCVEKYGKNIFGEKFISMREVLPRVDYNRLLESIDVAIYNHRRQQAGGNIWEMLKQGKKVFVRSDSPLYSHYASYMGFIMFPTESIKNSDCVEFAKFPKQQAIYNVEHNRIQTEKNFLENKWLLAIKNIIESLEK